MRSLPRCLCTPYLCMSDRPPALRGSSVPASVLSLPPYLANHRKREEVEKQLVAMQQGTARQ